jgi:hypothetical protein
VKSHIVLKVRLRSCPAIKVAIPCSCLLMHQIEYTDHALLVLVFCFSTTWPPVRYIDEVTVSSIDSIKARGCNSGLFLCRLLNEALEAKKSCVMEDPLENLVSVSWPHTFVSPSII